MYFKYERLVKLTKSSPKYLSANSFGGAISQFYQEIYVVYPLLHVAQILPQTTQNQQDYKFSVRNGINNLFCFKVYVPETSFPKN